MLPWVQLVVGIGLALFGLIVLLGVANVPAPGVNEERWALYGLIAGIAGVLSVVLGAIQLVGRAIAVVS